MGLPTVSFGGIASGIDTNAIISSLVALRRRPIALLERRVQDVQSSQSAMKQLADQLEKLEEVAAKFKERAAFSGFTAESDDQDVLTASADGSATSGVFSIHVDNLAKQRIDVASGIADSDTTSLGTGTIEVTVDGETTEVDLGSSANTLLDVVSAINAADAGVEASIVNDGGTDPFNFVLTAKESGTQKSFSLDFTGYTAGDVDLSTAFTTTQAAEDASLTVNSIQITRGSNTVDDVIPGVTLNLTGIQDAGENVTLTVGTDVDGLVVDIQEFVDAYNGVQSFLDRQFDFDQEAGAGGPLFGDFTATAVRSRLQAVIASGVDNGNTFGSLGAIGLRSTSNGTLSVDETDLRDAIEQDAAQVIDLFVENGGGILSSLESTVEEFTRFDGILDSRNDGFDRLIKNLNDQIDRSETRLDNFEANLTRRFASFESAIGGLQAQLSFLQSSLAS